MQGVRLLEKRSMLKELDSLIHMKNLMAYNFAYDSSNDTYTFITKNNILYKVYFIQDHTFEPLGYQNLEVLNFTIEKLTDKLEPLDANVSLTIGEIIKDSILNTNRCILFVCDSSDNKELKRFKTFERWFDNSEYNQFFTKINNSETEKTNVFLSVIFTKNHSQKNQLKQGVSQIDMFLNDEK